MFSKHTPTIKQFIISSSHAGRKNVADTPKCFKVAYAKVNKLFWGTWSGPNENSRWKPAFNSSSGQLWLIRRSWEANNSKSQRFSEGDRSGYGCLPLPSFLERHQISLNITPRHKCTKDEVGGITLDCFSSSMKKWRHLRDNMSADEWPTALTVGA